MYAISRRNKKELDAAGDKFGIAKREILADRVDETRKAQQEAKEQFADALQRFLAITNSGPRRMTRRTVAPSPPR